MKYLIVYLSHHGTTHKVAMQLADHIGQEKTALIDLKTDDIPELSSFDTIIIGGSIHTGEIQKEISEFCINNKNVLLSKRVGLFICALEKHELKDEFENAFPQWLRDHAIAHGFFGGELLLDKMNFFEKIFVKGIYGIKSSVHELNQDEIDSFEQKIVDDASDLKS